MKAVLATLVNKIKPKAILKHRSVNLYFPIYETKFDNKEVLDVYFVFVFYFINLLYVFLNNYSQEEVDPQADSRQARGSARHRQVPSLARSPNKPPSVSALWRYPSFPLLPPCTASCTADREYCPFAPGHVQATGPGHAEGVARIVKNRRGRVC